MDRAGMACATLAHPNATYGLDNSYQCDSAQQYAVWSKYSNLPAHRR
jgi:hypothetical protein